MSTQVSDQAVGVYDGLVTGLAERLSRSPAAKRVGAEFDDLRQEGLINVWLTLQRGITPNTEHIENRMKDWIRYEGRSGGTQYAQILPLEVAFAQDGGE